MVLDRAKEARFFAGAGAGLDGSEMEGARSMADSDGRVEFRECFLCRLDGILKGRPSSSSLITKDVKDVL